MTTDTVAKVAAATVGGGPARVVGIAKGVGMIEPDMATMIAVLLTDAEVDPTELDARFRRVVDRTFNCVSIDTDTSTSDTAVVLASGAAGPVDGDELEAALGDVAEALTKQIARDGEGAETLIEVVVDGARDAGAGQAGRQGDRQLAAGEDRRARRRPELGPGGDGDRQVPGRHRHRPGAGGDPLRRPGGVPDAGRRRRAGRAVRLPRPATRCASTSRSAPATPPARCGAATSPTATSASTPTTRPDGGPAAPGANYSERRRGRRVRDGIDGEDRRSGPSRAGRPDRTTAPEVRRSALQVGACPRPRRTRGGPRRRPGDGRAPRSRRKRRGARRRRAASVDRRRRRAPSGRRAAPSPTTWPAGCRHAGRGSRPRPVDPPADGAGVRHRLRPHPPARGSGRRHAQRRARGQRLHPRSGHLREPADPPARTSDQHLLAHELAHTVQQRGRTAARRPARSGARSASSSRSAAGRSSTSTRRHRNSCRRAAPLNNADINNTLLKKDTVIYSGPGYNLKPDQAADGSWHMEFVVEPPVPESTKGAGEPGGDDEGPARLLRRPDRRRCGAPTHPQQQLPRRTAVGAPARVRRGPCDRRPVGEDGRESRR